MVRLLILKIYLKQVDGVVPEFFTGTRSWWWWASKPNTPRTQQQKFTKPQPRKALFWSRMPKPQLWAVLGGSWVAISRVISGVIISRVITHIRGRITPLITTPEPPSMAHAF